MNYLKLRKKLIRAYQTLIFVHPDQAPPIYHGITKRGIVANFSKTSPADRLFYYKKLRLVLADIKHSMEFIYEKN